MIAKGVISKCILNWIPILDTIASAHAVLNRSGNGSGSSTEGEPKLLAITDHAPALSDSSPALHFMNYHVLPKELYGVQMLYGVELNIMGSDGRVEIWKRIF